MPLVPVVTKFIMPHGNYGNDAILLPNPPAGEPDPDSDDPDGDAPSCDVGWHALSKRNTRFLSKHAVKVSASFGPEVTVCSPWCRRRHRHGAGHGLFSARDSPVGKELPVKGPWFHSLQEVHKFLAGLHVDTAALLSKRVVRVDLAPGADGPPAESQGQEQQKPTSLYKVITNPIGFVNHFTGLSTTPNCRLVLKEGMPLGEHCLILKSTRPIKAGKEWLLNYGPHHQCGERMTRKREREGAGGAGGRRKKQQIDTGKASAPAPPEAC